MHSKKSTISITHIKKKANRKTNTILAETILAARKQKQWLKIAHILSGATRKYSSVNLNEINSQAKEGDTLLILGKVLSLGNLTKKLRISALSISHSANEKLKASKSKFVSILDEIKENPKMEGVKIIKWK